MDVRREAKRLYRENPPPAGIYEIRNQVNHKVFIGSGLNVRGKLNSAQFTLRQGNHANQALQADWNRFGPEAFVCGVLDELKPAAGEPAVDRKELQELEEMWLEKLQPYGEKGYHARR